MILIDPACIAVPNFAESSDDVERLIDRLIEYARIVSSNNPFEIFVDDNIEEKLGNLYPSFEAITDYLEMCGLDHVFQARDIAKQVGAILARSTRWSDADLPLVEAFASLEIQPPLPALLYPRELAEETHYSLLAVSVASSQFKCIFLSSPFPDYNLTHYSIHAKSIHLKRAGVLSEIPAFTGSAKTLPEIFNLMTLDTAHEKWRSAQNSSDIFAAIIFGGVALTTAANKEIREEIRSFSVGSDFIQSLRDNQAFRDGVYAREVANTCFELVSGTFGGTDRIFGRYVAQTRPRDGASGRRCHVTKGGVGLRLMYWNKGNHLEFSNIGPKFELIIKDGDKSCETAHDFDDIISIICRSRDRILGNGGNG